MREGREVTQVDAAVNLMSLVQSEGADRRSAPAQADRSSEPAEPFGNVLEKASETRETKAGEATRRDRPEDPRPEDADRAQEDESEDEEERRARKAREAGSRTEVVVPGGINLVVQPAEAAGQEVAEPQPPVAGGAVLPANGDAQGLPTPAQPAGDAASLEAQAKLEAMQAKIQATVPGGTGEEAGEQSQTLDRGAAAKAALERLAAGAKGESVQQKLAAAEQPGAGTQPGAGNASPKAESLVPVPGAVVEKPAEAQSAQITSSSGAERADGAQALAGLGKVEARAEGNPARDATGAGQSSEPAVNRQEIMDQVVRSARLHMERGLSRFEMRLEPPSLGRLKVVMDLKDGTLSINFRVESQAVKEAVQNSLPQLREALAAQGLTVDGFDVQGSGRGVPQNGDGRQEPAPGGRNSGNPDAPETEPATVRSEAVRAGNGLVDCWA
jgi:flagellar hook-length control protein FliK